jgi:hypothetical protein
MKNLTPPDCVTAKQLAKELNVHKVTVNKWRLDGRGPLYVQHGGRIFYPVSLVKHWLLVGDLPPPTPKRKKSRGKRK